MTDYPRAGCEVPPASGLRRDHGHELVPALEVETVSAMTCPSTTIRTVPGSRLRALISVIVSLPLGRICASPALGVQLTMSDHTVAPVFWRSLS